jgi:hypothetical protein
MLVLSRLICVLKVPVSNFLEDVDFVGWGLLWLSSVLLGDSILKYILETFPLIYFPIISHSTALITIYEIIITERVAKTINI